MRLIAEQLSEGSALLSNMAERIPARVFEISQVLLACLRRGGTILLCGNGGSAADAQHIACELVVKFGRVRRGIPAIALTVNTSVLTAASNDLGFREVFVRQVEALGRKGDVLIAISTSGRSPNILAVVKQARKMGLVTVGFSGGSGGPLARACDLCLTVPSTSVPHIQEAHIAVGHILCGIVEEALGGTE
jgi:D-sedoheptulose 7-phosphate isomerase